MATATEAKTVYFTVTGEYLTDIARDLLLSDEPGKAYRIIADHLIGEGGIEAALSVLKGTHDLAGDSRTGIFLTESEVTPKLRGFHKDIGFIYAGRHRRRGAWWRPVAVVTNFNKDDADYAGSRVSGGGLGGSGNLKLWGRARTEYYCNPGESVGEKMMKMSGSSDKWIIWEACGEMPHWVKPNVTEQEAFDEFLKERKLENRGAEISDDVSPTNDGDTVYTKSRFRPWPKDEEGIRRRKDEEEEIARRVKLEIERIGEEVRTQAGDNTFVLELLSGRKITVPRAPFIRWASRRSDIDEESLPEWENISPSGMKMMNDNQDHTDWVLGSGLTFEEAYEDEVKEPAWEEAFRIQEEGRGGLDEGIFPLPSLSEALDAPPESPAATLPSLMAAIRMLQDTVHPAAVVVDAGERTGIVGVDIAVFPDSEAKRVKQIGKSVGVIVEKAGRLAHFAIVTKGMGITVMCHPNACELFKPGTRVILNPATGRIVIDDEE